MSRPPINPERSAAGIALDPSSLDRVVPASRRADGSIRKEIKIRPGFTPQEDVKRFRGTKQAQMDASALPKGHIIGWAPPKENDLPVVPLSKNAKKRQKQREKKKEEAIKDNWEDDDEEEDEEARPEKPREPEPVTESTVSDLADQLDKTQL